MEPVTADAAIAAAGTLTQINPTEVFTSFDFYVTVMAVWVLVTLTKQGIFILRPEALSYKSVKFILNWLGPVLGGLIALVPGIWDAFTPVVALLVGVPCGFFAERSYDTILRPLFPNMTFAASSDKRTEDEDEQEVT